MRNGASDVSTIQGLEQEQEHRSWTSERSVSEHEKRSIGCQECKELLVDWSRSIGCGEIGKVGRSV